MTRSRPDAIGLPDALTPAAVAVCVWGGAAGSWPPSLLAALSVAAAYGAWRRRGRRWHDRANVALLLPALAAALWLAAERVAPGVALTGLVCTLLGYQGRHHPFDGT